MASTTSLSAVLSARDDPSSPLHYAAGETALILLDFQTFIVSLCGSAGDAAVTKAARMRAWALKHEILVLHSLVDVHGAVPETVKGRPRITGMLSSLGPEAGVESSALPWSDENAREHVVRKAPGTISGLQSRAAMELLVEHGIKSLIICGLSTSGAVLRTAVPATDENFVVTVVRDACADPREGLHEVLMEQVLPSRAHVVEAAEFIVAWEKTRKEGE